MKTFLLVLLASGPLMTLVSPEPTNAYWPYCSYNQVYSRTYYYEYPGGPECGFHDVYCEHQGYQEGCVTPYYDEWYAQCECQ